MQSQQQLIGIRASRILAASLLVFCTYCLWSAKSHAQQAGQPGEVLVIVASTQPGDIDGELKKIAALRKPPFNGFSSMKVLSKHRVSPAVGKPSQVALPNGRRLVLSLEAVLKNGRLKVRVAINKPEAKDYLPGMVVVASPGEPFFVAGQKHQGGTLIVGVTVGERSAAK